MSRPRLKEVTQTQLVQVSCIVCTECNTHDPVCDQCNKPLRGLVTHIDDPCDEHATRHFCTASCLVTWGVENAIDPPTQAQVGEHKTEKVKELAEKWGLKLETIEASTCPYGDLNQHMNDTANCELGDECVYSGKPVTL